MTEKMSSRGEAAGAGVVLRLREAFNAPGIDYLDLMGLLGFKLPHEILKAKRRNMRAGLLAAASGKGAREVRVAIALALKTLPSELWPTNSATTALRDDEEFKEKLEQSISSKFRKHK